MFIYSVGETMIGKPKIQNNLGAFKFLFCQCYNRNSRLFFIAFCKDIALNLLTTFFFLILELTVFLALKVDQQ